MSNHLSQDQMARWVLGQSTAEEEEHGRSCSRCSAELKEIREAVSAFQSVMKNWSEREIVPRLDETPGASASALGLRRPSLRWALAAAGAALLVAVSIYRQQEPAPVPESATQAQVETNAGVAASTNEDVVLMEEVTTHLARPLPKPMQRVIILLPSEEASMIE
jgi:hypothetical protein